MCSLLCWKPNSIQILLVLYTHTNKQTNTYIHVCVCVYIHIQIYIYIYILSTQVQDFLHCAKLTSGSTIISHLYSVNIIMSLGCIFYRQSSATVDKCNYCVRGELFSWIFFIVGKLTNCPSVIFGKMGTIQIW